MFHKISDELIHQLASISLTKHFHKGKLIFQEGFASNGFYVIAEGHVKIFKSSPEGKEQIIYTLGPGEIFEISAIFNNRKFPVSATCICSSSVLFFPQEEFLYLATKHPNFILSILTEVSQRLCMLAQKIGSLSLQEVPARLADHFIYLTEQQGRIDQITLDMSKKHLASLLGTSPENLSRIFACMSRSGLIQVQGSTVILIKYRHLVQIQQLK